MNLLRLRFNSLCSRIRRSFRIIKSYLFYQDKTLSSRLYRNLGRILKSEKPRRVTNLAFDSGRSPKSLTGTEINRLKSTKGVDVDLFYVGRAGLASLMKMTVLCADLLISNQLSVRQVDFLNHPVAFSRHRKWMGELNAWNYYFRQPKEELHAESQNRLERISTQLEMRSLVSQHELGGKSFNLLDDEVTLKRLRRVFSQVFRLNPRTLSCLNELIDILDFEPRNTLGVFFRGIPHYPNPGHPKSFSTNQIMVEINKSLKSNHLQNLIISTHNSAARQIILGQYSKKVRVIPDFRFKNGGEISSYLRRKYALESGLPLDNLDYLLELLLLSRCSYFLGEIGNAAAVVSIASNDEQKRVILSQGVYN